MRWFFISAVLVLLIAVGLSHLATNSLGQNTLHMFVMEHHYFWLMVRVCIIVGFVLIWPYLVKNWAKKYGWDEEYAQGIIRRRWRFAVWLILIDLTFQLL